MIFIIKRDNGIVPDRGKISNRLELNRTETQNSVSLEYERESCTDFSHYSCVIFPGRLNVTPEVHLALDTAFTKQFVNRAALLGYLGVLVAFVRTPGLTSVLRPIYNCELKQNQFYIVL